MVNFYDRWRRLGVEPPEALRQAQRWLRDTTNGHKRERFARLMDSDAQGWLPSTAAQACWETVVLKDPDTRGFANPADWAAFSCTGA